MIEKLTEMYHQYYNQIMVWYNNLDEIQQVGVLFVCFVTIAVAAALLLLSRIIKR